MYGFMSQSVPNIAGPTKTEVKIGSAFPQWFKMRVEKGLKNHAEVTTFLLDRQANIYKLTLVTAQVHCYCYYVTISQNIPYSATM